MGSRMSLVRSPVFGLVTIASLLFGSAALAGENKALCDRLAASAFDTSRPAPVAGVEEAAIDVAAALPACSDAYRNQPEDGRYAFQLGRVFSRDGQTDKAIALYREAAEAGHVIAMVNLAIAIEDAAPAEAFGLYSKAAEAGSMLGQYNLGVAHQNGVGTPIDGAKALDWFEKASAQGDDVAAYNVAVLLDEGKLVPRDMDRAVTFYRLAIDRGNVDAMVNLAVSFERGDGVAKDPVQALALYRQAAELGDAEAAGDVARLQANQP